MRNYTARIEISDIVNKPTGQIGEIVFQRWFENTYQGEKIHPQNLDRDYQGIDFACNKGYTYQVKATKNKTYTFNSPLEDIKEYLKADFYILVQIKNYVAYIEAIYKTKEIEKLFIKSYNNNNNCFLYAKNLLQTQLYN